MESFPFEQAPQFLLRDRDGIYGQNFRDRVEHMGIEEVRIAFRSPRGSPYVERLIGSIRRGCPDHVIAFNEEHLRRLPTEYSGYYHQARAHLSLERNSPIPRVVCPPEQGNVVAETYLGACTTATYGRHRGVGSVLSRLAWGRALRHARAPALATG